MPVNFTEGTIIVDCAKCGDHYDSKNDLDAVKWVERHWLETGCEPLAVNALRCVGFYLVTK